LNIKHGVRILYGGELIIGRWEDKEMGAITSLSKNGDYIVKHEHDSTEND
jgi:hypothetical protein